MAGSQDGFTVVPQPFTDKSFPSVAHLLTSHLRGLGGPLLTQVNLNEIVASKTKHKKNKPPKKKPKSGEKKRRKKRGDVQLKEPISFGAQTQILHPIELLSVHRITALSGLLVIL